MKRFIVVGIVLFLSLMVFNIFNIKFTESLLSETNTIALITILSSACGIALLSILAYSMKIAEKSK